MERFFSFSLVFCSIFNLFSKYIVIIIKASLFFIFSFIFYYVREQEIIFGRTNCGIALV